MNKRKANYSDAEMLAMLNSLFAVSDADKQNYADRYSHAWRYYMAIEPYDKHNSGVDPEPVVRDVVDLNFQIMQGLFNSSSDSSVVVTSNNMKASLADAIGQALNELARNVNNLPRKLENWQREALLTGQSHMKVFLENKVVDERVFHFEDKTEAYLVAFEEELKSRGYNEVDVKINAKKTKTKRTTKDERAEASALGLPVVKSYKLFTGSIDAVARVVMPAVDYIPFEEVYIHPYTQYSLDDSPYMCHRYQFPISSGLMNGWDEDVMKAGIDFEEDTDASFATTGLIIGQQYEPFQTTAAGIVINDNQEYFPVYEHYWRGAYKGSTPKLWKFTCTKLDFLQEPEEVEEMPFISARIHELPNSFYGMGIFDKVRTLQDDATRYKRMLTYSANSANLGQYWGVKDAYDAEAFLTPEPGGIIEVDAPNTVGVLPVSDASNALSMLINQNNSAVQMQMTSSSMALDDMAKMGETAGITMSMMINKQEQAPKSYANTFTQTGLIPLFKKLYKAGQQMKYPLKEELGGYDLSDFPKEIGISFDVSSTVEKAQASQNKVNTVMQIQQLYGGKLPKWVSDEDVYHVFADALATGTGNKDVSAYLTDPSTMKPSKLEIHLEALEYAAKESQLQASAITPYTENQKLVSEIRKNDAEATYYTAQMQSLKDKDKQDAELAGLKVTNQVLQNAKLAADTRQVMEETDEAPTRLAMDAVQIQSQITAEESNIVDDNYAQGSNVNL